MLSEKEDTQQSRLLLAEETEHAADLCTECGRNPSRKWLVTALSVSNVVLFALLLFSNINNISSVLSPQPPALAQNSTNLPPLGYPTELADALPYVEYTERNFSGELTYNTTSKQLYREVNASEPQYFGPASPAIDAAWHELLKDEFLVMTAEEAEPFGPELKAIMGKKKMEPSYTHGLHCLNALRKKLDPEYYADKPNMWKLFPAEFERTHDDHCLDFIFQLINCAGDLTPSPLYSWDGFGMAIGRSGVHTCRRTKRLVEWARGRSERESEPREDEHRHGKTPGT